MYLLLVISVITTGRRTKPTWFDWDVGILLILEGKEETQTDDVAGTPVYKIASEINVSWGVTHKNPTENTGFVMSQVKINDR